MKPLVFITGASSGIGQALALEFAQLGYRLVLVARRKDAIDAWILAQQLEAAHVTSYAADVCDIDSILGVAKACMIDVGLPDIVIANAGISIGMDSSIASDLKVMSRIFATNNVGLAATFSAFINPMKARGSGQLVSIASVAGIRGMPGHGAYSSSKAAVITYCESLRGDLLGTGVTVTTLLPGFIKTPMNEKNTFSMPFLMAVSDFARVSTQKILAKKGYAVVPWQMGLVAKLLPLLPNGLYDRIYKNRPRKHRDDAA